VARLHAIDDAIKAELDANYGVATMMKTYAP
jgi:hypothetical protein